MSSPAARDEFLGHLASAYNDGSLVKATLGKPVAGEEARNVYFKPVTLKAGPRLQLVERFPTRDRTLNLELAEALEWVRKATPSRFQHAHLFTRADEWTLELDRAPRLRHRAVGRPEAAPKPVASTSAPAWLEALGGSGPAKKKQVEHFIEILGHLLADLPAGAGGRLVDMGCGRGLLTFAAHEALRRSGRTPDVRGIELRPPLVDKANAVVRELGLEGLRFESGAIVDVALQDVDVVVALHACDTATDDALARAIAVGAKLIVVAPCCHKEVRPRMGRPGPLSPALRHGLLVERQAEWLTDALRAGLLEVKGYHTRVFEFVSTEHTAKNVMIAATLSTQTTDRAAKEAEVAALASFWGVTHQSLADSLGVRLQ